MKTTVRKLKSAARRVLSLLDVRRAGGATAHESDVFTRIFKKNHWGSRESVSGVGSQLDQTRTIIRELPGILRKFGVATMLDLPCGDFNWMQHVDLTGVDYIGADIVEEIVRRNEREHARPGRSFRRLNLLADPLPQVDLIFCRDCLVHLSHDDVRRALDNICRSGAKYLMTTTFVGRTSNIPITTGQWRPLNLTISPFSLPAADLVLNEGCTEINGEFADKSLGVWEVAKLRTTMQAAA